MIQRVQSIYLALAAVVTLVFAFTTFAYFEVNDSLYFLRATGLFYQDTSEVIFLEPNMSVSAVVLFSLLLCVSAVFNYKNRATQLRLVSLGIVAQLALVGLIFFASSFISEGLFEGTAPVIEYEWVSFLPVLSIISLFMAMRGIKKDEALIKSLDRIR